MADEEDWDDEEEIELPEKITAVTQFLMACRMPDVDRCEIQNTPDGTEFKVIRSSITHTFTTTSEKAAKVRQSIPPAVNVKEV